MSWTVDGHRYENYREYQSALAAREGRAVAGRISALTSTINHLESRIEKDHRALNDVRNDVRRQAEISQRIQANIREMQRAHDLLAELQQDTDRRMEEGFRQLEEEVTAAQGEIHGQRVKLDELRHEHETHVANVRRSFDQVKEQLRSGLRQAEKRLQEAETRLRSEIREVDAKFEADLQQRLAKAGSQMERANEQLTTSQQILESHEASLDRFNLREEDMEVREDLAQARRCVAHNDAASALALAGGALSKARALSHRVSHREVEMATRKQVVLDQVEDIRARLDRGKDPDVPAYFNRELTQAEELLNNLERRAANGYTSYRTMITEEHENEKLLRQVEGQAFQIVSSTPIVKQMALDRVAQTEKLIAHLESVYGPVQTGSSHFADPLDPKSPLIVECDMGGAKVNLHLDLEGGYRIDGFAHGSNQVCAHRGQQVAQLLSEKTLVTGHEVEPNDRMGPKVEVSKKEAEHMQVGRRLTQLKESQ